MIGRLGSVVAALCVAIGGGAWGGEEAANVVLENEHVRYVIGADARNVSFLDKLSGTERMAPKSTGPWMIVKKGSKRYPATACSHANGTLSLAFGDSGITVAVKAACRKHALVFEIASVSDPEVDEVQWLNLPVACAKYVSGMSGMAADEAFAACVRVLDLRSRGTVGGRPPVLAATSYRTYGLVGARVALVGCPAAQVRPVLQEVMRAEGLPVSPLGGPWALDAPENRGSYVFASVSEKNVDEWIALAKRAGLAQVHFCGWWHSLGHYQPRKDAFPNGLEGLKATVAKVHAAGLKAGMHTLTGCISVNDPWVRPVPDPRLATDASFTLAAAVDERATTLLTQEPPAEFDTVWAYAGRGNVVRLGDELVQFSGLSRTAPFGFTGCTRGAFGTNAAPHAKGAAADHLFVRYTSFQPDENSTLVDGVAAEIARVFNTCEFDMIYMDGAEGMVGGWHGVAKMRRAIFRKLKRRALVEASSWGYHSWPFHSRVGAWDHPKWGLKQFIDVHCRATEQYRRSSLLAAQLGWWAILGPTIDHDAELPDELEYLCCKALGHDAPMSFQSVGLGDKPPNARQNDYLAMVGRYERLRLAGYFSEAVREKLRDEGAEFHLEQAPDGEWQLIPTQYAEHKVTALDDGSSAWQMTNAYGEQRPQIRIVALHSVEPYESAGSVLLADFAKDEAFGPRTAASGVTCELTRSGERAGRPCGLFAARSTRTSPKGAWAKAPRTLSPHVDLSAHGAMGLWVHGDGKGGLLNVQLTNPRQYWTTWDEHYVRLDFKGWRYVELLLRERDAAAFGGFTWPYGGHYAVYRSPLIRKHVSGLNLYLNNLAPGDTSACTLSAIKALATKKVTLRNPAIRIGGQRILFPVELESGSSIELTAPDACVLRDARGAVVRQVRPQGDAPMVKQGDNRVEFTCEGTKGYRARARVTVITSGEPLRGRAGAK